MPRISVRLGDEQYKEMKADVENGAEFANYSHYIRRAIETFQAQRDDDFSRAK